MRDLEDRGLPDTPGGVTGSRAAQDGEQEDAPGRAPGTLRSPPEHIWLPSPTTFLKVVVLLWLAELIVWTGWGPSQFTRAVVYFTIGAGVSGVVHQRWCQAQIAYVRAALDDVMRDARETERELLRRLEAMRGGRETDAL